MDKTAGTSGHLHNYALVVEKLNVSISKYVMVTGYVEGHKLVIKSQNKILLLGPWV